MSDYSVRVLRSDEHRAACDLFYRALHRGPITDEAWERHQYAFQPGRALGAFDSAMIGTTRSFDAEMTVPGGKRVPHAAVTGVAVRSDRTRRGVLSGLMRAQLTDLSERDVVLASLHATEGVIYGRYGYGVGTVTHNVKVGKRRAVIRPEVPSGGDIELLDLDEAAARLPEIYAALPHDRAGRMARPEYSWAGWERRAREADPPPVAIIHKGPSGVDGYASYDVKHSWESESVLYVNDFFAATDEAFAGLWRYLLSVDLVDVVRLFRRPGDEPTPLLFTDPRACENADVSDDLWLRLVNVPAALAARTYGRAEPVVLEIEDPVLEANNGRYRVGEDGVARTDDPADLTLGADALAMLYLGTWRASALAAPGRLRAADPKALDRAETLFAVRDTAWCGTYF